LPGIVHPIAQDVANQEIRVSPARPSHHARVPVAFGDNWLSGTEGDAAVAEEVDGRYLELERQMESLPPSSVAIAPANYKFHFRGEVKTGGGAAFV
jgi:hypothetical protein